MSVSLAFSPWARLGIGTALSAQPDALRAQVPIGVQVRGRIVDPAKPGAPAVDAPVVSAPPFTAQILGPGDVLGIDPRIIIRVDPGPYARSAPARTLAAIEFSRPDFPWMFSPLVPDVQQRLQPWLCLVVVPQRPGISLEARDGRLPVLTVDSGSELPDLAEAWAWAHVQVLSEGTHPVSTTVAEGNERSLSRLVSPRCLDSATRYLACLVPTFNVGRQVGLDPTVEPTGPLAPAWSAPVAANFKLPVYYSWTFATGIAGDFQDLVVMLQPQQLPLDVGWRPVTIGFPTAVPPAGFHAFTEPLEGVLRNLHDPPAVSDPGAATMMSQELDRIVGLPRTVAPPRYGQSQGRVGAPWLDDLNLTPVARIAAATGARVVQTHQDELLAAAWAEVGDMQRANQERRQIDVAITVGDAVMRRHFGAMSTDCVFQMSAPTGIPTRGGVSSPAVAAAIPPATLSGAFRRLQRRSGSLARRSAPVVSGSRLAMMALPVRSGGPSAMTVLARFRLVQTAPDKIPATPAVLPFSDADAAPLGRTSARATFTFTGKSVTHPSTHVTTNIVVVGASVPWRLDDATQFVTDADAAALKDRQMTASNFKTAALAMQHYLFDRVLPRMNPAVFRPVTPDDAALSIARGTVLDALNPARTLVARVAITLASPAMGSKARAPAPPSASSSGPSAIAALRYDPIFAQGMFRAVAELTPDLFLVGADRLPDNTVGVVRTNARFIEAYLVGLNHEMAREFLWRGFPSDGRGTYFRRFWDSDNYPALSAWRGMLGTHGSTPDFLALLIRSEIVRRFPSAVVFAQRGGVDQSGAQFVPSEPRRYPLFRVRLRGDLLCVGFDFTPDQAFGYFFGIEEQITEPRFAAPTTPRGPFVKLSDLTLRTGAHAGDVAAAALRRPTRVMIDPHVLIK